MTTARRRPGRPPKAQPVSAEPYDTDNENPESPDVNDAHVGAPERPAMRAAMRSEDPRARAAARAAELKGHVGSLEDAPDKFYVDTDTIPEGWDYEWKRKSVLGAEDPSYEVQVARGGWEPVPPDRHPGFMPKGFKGESIERDGLVLMERPKEITEAVREADRRRARAQVRQKEEQLNAAPAGQFERNKSDGSSLVKVSKSYEPMQIPE